MKLSFGNITMDMKVFNVAKQPIDEDECHHADMIDTLVTKEFYKSHEFDRLNYILCDVDNKILFYPDNLSNVSTNFKTQDRRTKLRQQQLKNLPLESKKPEPSALKTLKDNLSPEVKGLKYILDNG